MLPTRSLLGLLALSVACGGVLFACSSTNGDHPPLLVDVTDATTPDTGVVVPPADPCDPPQQNCPCADAGAGAQLACGTVYRNVNNHVDCSKGFRTCQDPGDGGAMLWGACEGPRILNADY